MLYQSECILQVYYQLGNKPDGLNRPEVSVLRNSAFISDSLKYEDTRGIEGQYIIK